MHDLIFQALKRPDTPAAFSLQEWDLLIRQGRRANLLSRLAWLLGEAGCRSVPAVVARHLLSAEATAERQRTAIRWEVECIRAALAVTGVPLVLLKGAAYVLADLPTAKGRLFSDVDIIVPKQSIAAVEAALLLHGWNSRNHTAYDQRYYRHWMHEIPPMQHVRRGSVLDVHHAILPETARIKTNAKVLLANTVQVASGVFVLAPTDMLLHSATHLFHEGELDNGLRDLFDIDSLLRHFGAEPEFWDRLVPRAVELGLTRPLYYALRYSMQLLDTPIPEPIARAAAVGRPSPMVRALMDFCYLRALRVNHSTCSDRWTPVARRLLYVRSHWLRMPFLLLVFHLARKAFISDRPPGSEAGALEKQQEQNPP